MGLGRIEQAAAGSPESHPVTSGSRVGHGRTTLALLPHRDAVEILGTTVTLPGISGEGLAGQRHDGGNGRSGHDLAVGQERARPPGRMVGAAGSRPGWGWRPWRSPGWLPSFSANGACGTGSAGHRSTVRSGVPVSSTSWMRQSSHMPWAKCG